ncbi:TetR/AcrR family transcriptional regulator [Nocardia sp. NPDC059246]|uniref:TetR/AcrR family transcriptional regulator n=1 Tax=unclassified Nocardia TaxID=2637762 RepID=UPI0036779D86
MEHDSIARRRPRQHDGRSTAELAVFAATEQLLQESSLRDITVAKILSRAKLSRANFYHYFASKYDVIAAMVARMVEGIDAGEGPLRAELSATRKPVMEADLRHAIDIWSEHSALICAVIEHIHVVPQLAAAWNLMLDRFVSTLVEQINREREADAAPGGAAAEMIATVLVCGYERCFYVGARSYDSRLPDPDAAVDSIIELTFAAIYGDRSQVSRAPRRRKRLPQSRQSAGSETRTAGTGSPAPTHGGGDPDTMAAILRATSELLGKHSMDQLSVANILERADISRATFYFYFGSKDDVFLALFHAIVDGVVSRFSRLADIDRADPEQIKSVVTHTLDLDPESFGVLRNAVHEWPHRPQLRQAYLATMSQVIGSLETAIESDRAAGLALEGPPAPQLAAAIMWTVERTIAGSLAGEAHLEDTAAIAGFLGDLLIATVYTR